MRLDPIQHLMLRRLAWRLPLLQPRLLKAFQARLHDRQIGKQQFLQDLLRLPQRVDAAGRSGYALILESPYHQNQGIHGPHAGEEVGAELITLTLPLIALDARPPLGKLDGGGSRFLGVAVLDRVVEARVGHADHAHMHLSASKGVQVDRGPGQSVVKTGLAGLRQTDDSYLHKEFSILLCENLWLCSFEAPSVYPKAVLWRPMIATLVPGPHAPSRLTGGPGSFTKDKMIGVGGLTGKCQAEEGP